ncbi:MAG: dipeptide epimerase, partial [Thermoplasmata archaeon]
TITSFMINKINFKKITIQMKKPFRIYLGSSDIYEGYLVKVETDEKVIGFGESVPSPYITGDSLGSIEEELKSFSQLLKGDEISTEILNEKMKKRYKGSKASRAAIDMAIWDIIGKISNKPVYQLLGKYRDEIKTSYTVDLVDPEDAIEMAKSFLSQGVKVFKIKLGSGLEKDVERVKNVRETIGEKMMIYVDFNQAYNPKMALKVIKNIEKYNIEFVEQPVPAYDLNALKWVKEKSEIPVMGDESIFSIYDAAKVISMEAVDMINVKIMKAGGITEGIKIIDVAESFGIPVMIGCMVETKLALSAGLNLALSKSNVKYADLDGDTSLLEDITEEGIIFKEGKLSFKGLPGLGVKVKDLL